MEVLSLAGSRPPHEDVPIDLSTGNNRLRQHHHHHLAFAMPDNHWRSLTETSTAQMGHHAPKMEPAFMRPPSPPRIHPTSSHYIPIPKKRHCLARASTPTSTTSNSPSSSLNPTSHAGHSPPSASDCTTFSSLPPESARKRARLEDDLPSFSSKFSVHDLSCQRFSTTSLLLADSNNCTSVITSNTSFNNGNHKSSLSNGRRSLSGEELSGRGTEERVAARGGVSQSAMRQRQKHRLPSSDAGNSASASGTSVPGLVGHGVVDTASGGGGGIIHGLGIMGMENELGNGGVVDGHNTHLLGALMQLQAVSQPPAEFLPSAAIKDTEALFTAVRQSQILYYTYCTQLLQNLRAKHANNHPQIASQAQQHLQQLQLLPPPPEETRLDYDIEDNKPTPMDDVLSKSSEEYEESGREEDQPEDEDHLSNLNSILRMRLNTQESLDSQLSPVPSPCGTLPSSTTGGEDLDYSPGDASGRARKRAPRALTGKHVRPGTGASATTLLTLRQKLQERQKYRDQYGTDPPTATKSKGKSKKR